MNQACNEPAPPLVSVTVAGATTTSTRVCPDHLTLDHIGAADSRRGKFVRFIFWMLKAWPA